MAGMGGGDMASMMGSMGGGGEEGGKEEEGGEEGLHGCLRDQGADGLWRMGSGAGRETRAPSRVSS